MANVVAFNAKEAGDILVWRPAGSDTPVVYSYTCPVDNHKVVSAVRLGYDSSGNLVGPRKCPVHDKTLTGETAVNV